VIIFYKFEGTFRLCPKVKIISLHAPGTTETFRQVLRVGAYRNVCIVAGDNSEQLVRAARLANYLDYKRDQNDRGVFQRTVVPAGRFLEANVL
jgi:hypothetical protein